MATLRELIIKISANSTSFQSEIARASRMGADYHRSMSQGNRQSAAAARESQRALGALNAQLASTRQAALAMGGAFAGAFAVGNLIRLADGYNSLSARLKLATVDAGDFSAAQRGLMDISQRTGSAFSDNASLFSRASASLREWGYGTKDILHLTDALATGLQVSGATAEETSSLIVQLSQALGRGVLRGQDFNSVSQSGGRIMKALADGMGVAQKDLKALADEGALTTDKIVPALISQIGQLKKEFASMPDSVAAASNRISNAFQQWVGGVNQSSGATATLSAGMNSIASNIDGVATAAGVLAAVGLARVIGGWSTSMYQASRAAITAAQGQLAVVAAQREGLTTSLALTQAEKASAMAAQQSLAAQMKLAQTEKTRHAIRLQMAANAAAITRLTQAETAATAQLAAVQSRLSVTWNLASKVLSVVGGIPGVLMLGAGMWYMHYQSIQQSREEAREYAKQIDSIIEKLPKMTLPQASESSSNLRKSLTEQNRLIDEQQSKIAGLKRDIDDLNKARADSGLKGQLKDADLLQGLESATAKLAVEQSRLNEQKQEAKRIQDALGETQRRENDLIKESAWQQNAAYQSLVMMTGQYGRFNQALSVTNGLLATQQMLVSAPMRIPAARLNEEQEKALKESERALAISKAKGREQEKLRLEYKADDLGYTKGDMRYDAVRRKFIDQGLQTYDNNQDNKTKKSGGGGKTEAEKTADTYTRLIKQQKEQIALAGQSTELAKLKYQTTQGELTSLTDIQKQTLLQNAALIDQKKIKEQLRDYEANLADSNASARASNSIDLIGYGEGSRERERMKEMLQIRQEFEEKNRDLLRQRQAESLDESLYQQEVSLNRKYLNERLADQEAYYVALDKLQNDWQGGVTEGMANWVNEASNYSSQAAAATQSAMTGMVDSIADALNGNKASWKDWTVDVLKSIQKIMVNAALVNGLKSLGGSMSGSGTSWVSSAGSFISGLFDSGGYTGDGGKYEPAGIVHRGEFVFDKESTARFGPENLYRMMKGYASGGLVGSATPLPRAQPVVSSGVSSIPVAAAPQVTVNITSDGNGSVQSAPGYEDFGRNIGQFIQQEYAKLRDRDLRPGGAITRAIKGR